MTSSCLGPLVGTGDTPSRITAGSVTVGSGTNALERAVPASARRLSEPKHFGAMRGFTKLLICRKGFFSRERATNVNHLADGRNVRFAHDWRVESSQRKQKRSQSKRGRARGEDKRTCWVNNKKSGTGPSRRTQPRSGRPFPPCISTQDPTQCWGGSPAKDLRQQRGQQ